MQVRYVQEKGNIMKTSIDPNYIAALFSRIISAYTKRMIEDYEENLFGTDLSDAMESDVAYAEDSYERITRR